MWALLLHTPSRESSKTSLRLKPSCMIHIGHPNLHRSTLLRHNPFPSDLRVRLQQALKRGGRRLDNGCYILLCRSPTRLIELHIQQLKSTLAVLMGWIGERRQGIAGGHLLFSIIAKREHDTLLGSRQNGARVSVAAIHSIQYRYLSIIPSSPHWLTATLYLREAVKQLNDSESLLWQGSWTFPRRGSHALCDQEYIQTSCRSTEMRLFYEVFSKHNSIRLIQLTFESPDVYNGRLRYPAICPA
jgi:hypothetical protein